jgi:uncharacterized Zn-binding protein involved in type VI secretion
MVLQNGPHCHAPIHPPAPPTTHPHDPLPLPIVKGQPNVLIQGKPAARLLDITKICTLATCKPAGPGLLIATSTVIIGGLPAARQGDMTAHPSCFLAPIPMPLGKIIPPCCPTVLIGG